MAGKTCAALGGGGAVSFRGAAGYRTYRRAASAGQDGGGLSVPLPLQCQTEALHARGPHPVAEVRVSALRRLAPADRTAVLAEGDAITRWPPETIRALGADRFGRPPAREVPQGQR